MSDANTEMPDRVDALYTELKKHAARLPTALHCQSHTVRTPCPGGWPCDKSRVLRAELVDLGYSPDSRRFAAKRTVTPEE